MRISSDDLFRLAGPPSGSSTDTRALHLLLRPQPFCSEGRNSRSARSLDVRVSRTAAGLGVGTTLLEPPAAALGYSKPWAFVFAYPVQELQDRPVSFYIIGDLARNPIFLDHRLGASLRLR